MSTATPSPQPSPSRLEIDRDEFSRRPRFYLVVLHTIKIEVIVTDKENGASTLITAPNDEYTYDYVAGVTP